MEKIYRRFFNVIVREDKGMRPIVLKCGLALALTFAGFLYSNLRTRRIKPSPKGNLPGHGSEANLRGIRASSSSSNIRSEGNNFDTEETCINKVVCRSSPIGVSPRIKQNEEKDDELNDPPVAYVSLEKDDYEQEIRKLRNMVMMLQERERSLEVQLLEYCGLREQETVVMELQNRLKISNMETKMFNLKVETLQSENRRLEAQISDHAKVVSELESSKTKVKFLKKKIRYEAEQNKEHIIILKQKVSKLQDLESKAVANDQEIQMKLKRLKDLEDEVEQWKKSNLRLEKDNSELARRLDSTQILANSVLEDPEADALREESDRLKRENERMTKEIEQLQADKCTDLEELVYLRWINACLRHESRNYQPPTGKTVARDLSKSLSPDSEKKAKQLILEYANNEGRTSSISDVDSDQWSSSQASFIDTDECSPLENSSDARVNHNSGTNKSKIFGKLMKLMRGKDNSSNLSSRVTSLEKSRSREYSTYTSPHDTGAYRSEYGTPTETSRNSLDLNRSMKEYNRRNSDVGIPKNFSPSISGAGDLKISSHSFSESYSSEKSNLIKYAEALKNSSSSEETSKHAIRRRSSSYSSF
ncbi:protein CHUP1, chloroplastic [Trifolium pratense]|uniref:protein CHUP1, chloroplastic n=1 Tax=Trifolium pratense TaxID=57577 RepID=UPI001E694A6E|nr:protein CHUP1, chloroplastic [Trifolium pratense]XP_045788275.1 protein CHUP1, chloroplastic [Trifolium pratense]